MADKATDVSIQRNVDPVVSYEGAVTGNSVSYRVKFFSVPAQAWCEFDFYPSASGNSTVFVRSPNKKTINLAGYSKRFRAGKVHCELKTKGVIRQKSSWVIGGVEIPI
jgi:hypothetical protein